MRSLFLAILTVCLPLLKTTAQSTRYLEERLNHYSLQHNNDLLFLHTDKHIYTNNEYLWFSAYLLRTGADSLPLHRVLSLVLVDPETQHAAMQQKFIMRQGCSSGCLALPDSIVPGNYRLLAYTNIMDKDSLPLALFTQDISIRSLRPPPAFSATLQIDTGNRQQTYAMITVKDNSTNEPVKDAAIQLWAGSNKPISATTDRKGMLHLLLPPVQDDTAGNRMITAKIKYQGDLVFLKQERPRSSLSVKARIRFYPEGGQLVQNTPCRIAWESTTTNGIPFAVKAVLYKNDLPADTLYTDASGLGVFRLSPQANTVYSIRIGQYPPGVKAADSCYHLPVTLSAGMTLQMDSAVTKTDSLRFRVYASGHRMVRMLVHNFHTVFDEEIFTVQQGYRDVLLLLNEIPRGLAAITLFDSLGRPLAERIFFAHYSKQAVLHIQPDKKTYAKREKVTLQFKLHNPAAAMANGFASISCAQANRFETARQKDIVSFALLEADLQELPFFNHSIRAMDNKDYLEKALLVRGWRKYTWQELLHDTTTVPSFYSPVITGRIAGPYKQKKPATLTLIGGDNMFSEQPVTGAGDFTLDYSQLEIAQDKKLWLTARSNKNEMLPLEITDPFVQIDTRLAAGALPENRSRFAAYSRELALQDANLVPSLPVVVVSAKIRKDNALFGGENRCGDYVCAYNILNCPNHRVAMGNHPPVKGKTYNSPGGGTVVYWGCMEEANPRSLVLQYDGIKAGKVFYAEDLSQHTDGNPEYISTLYWSPALQLDSTGGAECHFYTGDISGRFRIVVNGVAENNLFFATGTFDVE